MPIYEYRCVKCANQFETFVSGANPNAATCPSCGGAEPKRLMSVISGVSGGRSEPAAPACGSGACERCS